MCDALHIKLFKSMTQSLGYPMRSDPPGAGRARLSMAILSFQQAGLVPRECRHETSGRHSTS
jgi:hypothetical protein